MQQTGYGMRGEFVAKEYAKKFYQGKLWQECRDGYVKFIGGLCEECIKKGIFKAGEIVHHKIHITPKNIGDPAITLNRENLQLLCRECHAEKHKRKRRYRVDKNGKVSAI